MRNPKVLFRLLASGTLLLSIHAWSLETDHVRASSLGLVAMPTLGASASLGAAVHPAFGITALALMSAFLTNLMVVNSPATSESGSPAASSPEFREELAEYRNEAREILANPGATPSPELMALLASARARLLSCPGMQAPSEHELLLVLAVLEPLARDTDLVGRIDTQTAACATQM